MDPLLESSLHPLGPPLPVGCGNPSEKPLRSKSGGRSTGAATWEFKSSFANNQFVTHTDMIPPRRIEHFDGSPSKKMARSVSPLRPTGPAVIDSLAGTRNQFLEHRATYSPGRLSSPERHTYLREYSPSRVVKTSSFVNLPPMPPAIGVEYQPHPYMVEERSRSRSPVHMIERVPVHMVERPPIHMVEHVRHVPIQHVTNPQYHQDIYCHQLQAEVNELKARQGNYEHLMEVFKQLESKYHQSVLDMQTMQVEYSAKIDQDRAEAEQMIAELDLVRTENATAEEDQMIILDQICVVERDVYQACRELTDIRMQTQSIDLQNMDLKKQIDVQEHLKCNEQNVALNQFEKIKEMNDHQNSMNVECTESVKRIETMRLEFQMNEENIHKAHDLLNITTGKCNETTMKIVEVEKEVTSVRDCLMKLDEELNYMETCNDRHKQNTAYMTERLQKESDFCNENTVKLHDYEMNLVNMEKEEGALRYEIDGLRCSNEDLMNRKTNLQAEIAALDKQMGVMTHTNKNLSMELDGFVAADQEVQVFLNKKMKVDELKAKAEQELKFTIEETQARKEQIAQASAVNQYMQAKAHQERAAQIEHQVAMEKQMAIERAAMDKQIAIEKENIVNYSYVNASHRLSPRREIIIRKSVSPIRYSPGRSHSPLAPPLHYQTFNNDKRYSYVPSSALDYQRNIYSSQAAYPGISLKNETAQNQGTKVKFGESTQQPATTQNNLKRDGSIDVYKKDKTQNGTSADQQTKPSQKEAESKSNTQGNPSPQTVKQSDKVQREGGAIETNDDYQKERGLFADDQ